MNPEMNDQLSIYAAPVQQQNFRALMNAFAYPGRVQSLQSSGSALEQVLATLIDGEVSLADPDGLLSPETLLRLEAQMAAPGQAGFVACLGSRQPSFQPRLGSLEAPEHGATLILQVQSFGNSGNAMQLRLRGPGIASENSLWLEGLHPAWLQQRANWNAAFPMGIDFILVSQSQLVALPRTTQIQGEF
jgi:alpha-D-ribose 1-methylphosphonate 5-triphosphate synthase subunit PhnH